MPFERRDPARQRPIPNGRRLTDPRVPRSIFPFMIGWPVRPPMEWRPPPRRYGLPRIRS